MKNTSLRSVFLLVVVGLALAQQAIGGVVPFTVTVGNTPVQAFSYDHTDLTAAGWYSYNNPAGSSANPPDAILQAHAQVVAFVQTSEGLYLANVYDVPHSSGGSATLVVNCLTGNCNTATVVLQDDPGDSYACNQGNCTFIHGWADCCTDGFMYGPLQNNGGCFDMTLQLTASNTITKTVIASADGQMLSFPTGAQGAGPVIQVSYNCVPIDACHLAQCGADGVSCITDIPRGDIDDHDECTLDICNPTTGEIQHIGSFCGTPDPCITNARVLLYGNNPGNSAGALQQWLQLQVPSATFTSVGPDTPLDSTLLRDYDFLLLLQIARSTTAAEKFSVRNFVFNGGSVFGFAGWFQGSVDAAQQNVFSTLGATYDPNGEIFNLLAPYEYSCSSPIMQGIKSDVSFQGGFQSFYETPSDPRYAGTFEYLIHNGDGKNLGLSVSLKRINPLTNRQGRFVLWGDEWLTYLSELNNGPNRVANTQLWRNIFTWLGVCARDAPCSVGTCIPGQGCVQTPVVYNDSNACTIDSCNPVTGGAVYTPVTIDDNNVCTDDVCDAVTGVHHTVKSCDDHNACTEDCCDFPTGCKHTPVNYDDHDLCTVDSCHPVTGVHHDAVVCDDNNLCTSDSCSSASGCKFTPINYDDNDKCTIDKCDALAGVSHIPVTCSDNNVCTADSCDSATGCTYTPYCNASDFTIGTQDLCLWPPNHKYRCWTAAALGSVLGSFTFDDKCTGPPRSTAGQLSFTFASCVTTNGYNEVDACLYDAQSDTLCVLVEKSKDKKAERIYDINFVVTDKLGCRSTTVTQRVSIPHDHSPQRFCASNNYDLPPFKCQTSKAQTSEDSTDSSSSGASSTLTVGVMFSVAGVLTVLGAITVIVRRRRARAAAMATAAPALPPFNPSNVEMQAVTEDGTSEQGEAQDLEKIAALYAATESQA